MCDWLQMLPIIQKFNPVRFFHPYKPNPWLLCPRMYLKTLTYGSNICDKEAGDKEMPRKLCIVDIILCNCFLYPGAPYYIFYPTTSGPRLYWVLREDDICLTEDKTKASHFDVQYTSPAEPPYFYITARTDPDSRTPDPVVSISKKSRFGSRAELTAKMDEAKPKKIVFEFRNRIAPDIPFEASGETLSLPQYDYARIKPKDGKKFLIAHRTDFSSQLHLMSHNKSDKKPKQGKYFNSFGMESVDN